MTDPLLQIGHPEAAERLRDLLLAERRRCDHSLSPAAPAAGRPCVKILVKRRDKSPDRGWLFVSGATYRRLPIFGNPGHCKIFLDNLLFYRRKYGFDVLGYVLLPDHYHLLLAVPPDLALPSFLRDFKSAVGRQIVDSLMSKRQDTWLRRLRIARPPKRRRDAQFRVLQADNYIKRVLSESFFQQKLDYIHANPVRHGLVERIIDYPFSSARWYEGDGSKRAQWQGPLG